MALAITKDNFEEISASQLPVVIDFWAEWCGPCRMISPIIDELAGEYEGRAVIGKCDVDNNDDIVGKFMVRNIPTIVFIKGGQVVDKQVGACTKADLVKKLEKALILSADEPTKHVRRRGGFPAAFILSGSV